ncbi:glycosyltransferase family 4 protein [Peptostreptococcus faecalis]|uniref:glycosyltransferase family 4 protein n=1 Tax=Peptostreptococcus faecalis TaxID=2045015 RepID=UPI000C7A0048|nr:glycosyltransferase family 4 protein [Peptostreptococcus faecalis]
MNILHISAQKPDSTGSGIYLSGLIKGLEPMCSSQTLIAGIDKTDSIESIYDKFGENFKLFPVVYNAGDLNFNVPGMSDSMPYPSTRYRDMNDDMAEKMKKNIISALEEALKYCDPDVIVCHHLYYATSIVREFLPDKKIVAICHGTCIRQLKSHDFKKKYILENISKLDMIFSLHHDQKGIIEDLFNLPSEKVEVLGSGYNKNVFNNKCYEKNGQITISYAGKISYSKGLKPFIECLEELDYGKDSIKFIMAGDGSDLDEVEDIKSCANNSKYEIEFAGRVNQEKLAEILNKSDIFVLPSYYEGLPLVILEAMACGNYVISTDVPGVKRWMGDKINNCGMIDYVSLPKMEKVSVPMEDEIPAFESRLRESLIKAIEYRKKDRTRCVEIGDLSWEGLSKKLYNFISK